MIPEEFWEMTTDLLPRIYGWHGIGNAKVANVISKNSNLLVIVISELVETACISLVGKSLNKLGVFNIRFDGTTAEIVDLWMDDSVCSDDVAESVLIEVATYCINRGFESLTFECSNCECEDIAGDAFKELGGRLRERSWTIQLNRFDRNYISSVIRARAWKLEHLAEMDRDGNPSGGVSFWVHGLDDLEQGFGIVSSHNSRRKSYNVCIWAMEKARSDVDFELDDDGIVQLDWYDCEGKVNLEMYAVLIKHILIIAMSLHPKQIKFEYEYRQKLPALLAKALEKFKFRCVRNRWLLDVPVNSAIAEPPR